MGPAQSPPLLSQPGPLASSSATQKLRARARVAPSFAVHNRPYLCATMPVAVAAAAAVAEAATSQEAPVLQASVIACDTLRALQVPPMQRQLGPNVQHVNLRRDGLLSEVLAEELGLPQACIVCISHCGSCIAEVL